MPIPKYLDSCTFLLILVYCLSFLSCNTKVDYSKLESYKCPECKAHFDSKFELNYETLALVTRGDEIATDGSNWDKLAEEKFGSVSKIKMCREGNYKEFKRHLYCYIGLDYKTMMKVFPKGVIKEQETTDSTKYFNIEVEIGKSIKYPTITWFGTWEKQFSFKKVEDQFRFLGNMKESELLENCLK